MIENRNGMDIDTGIDLCKLVEAGDFICTQIGKQSRSKCALALRKCS